MDGENNGSKPYEQMDDLGVKTHYFWVDTHILYVPVGKSNRLQDTGGIWDMGKLPRGYQ